MAQFQATGPIYENIKAQTKGIWDDEEVDEIVHSQIAAARQNHPYLQDLTLDNYHSYHCGKYLEKWKQEKAQPLHTAKQLFETAYNWDPMGPTGGKDLHQLLGSEHFENITLGKLRGDTRLDLIPAIGALPSSEIPDDCTTSDLAYTNGGAISYPDGYPSEADHHKYATSTPKDDKLRRFMPLGYVIKVLTSDGKKWEKTGHVLVIDMDEGRDRHPWFILATEWPDDRDIPLNSDMTVYAEKYVGWNNRNVHGVLPGDNNRTPVARLRTNPKKLVAGPMLLQFGPDFEFDITRLGGGQKGALRTGRGPDLANIMYWYEDTERNEEVCYSQDGKEYMRFSRVMKQYRYRVSTARLRGLAPSGWVEWTFGVCFPGLTDGRSGCF